MKKSIYSIAMFLLSAAAVAAMWKPITSGLFIAIAAVLTNIAGKVK